MPARGTALSAGPSEDSRLRPIVSFLWARWVRQSSGERMSVLGERPGGGCPQTRLVRESEWGRGWGQFLEDTGLES